MKAIDLLQIIYRDCKEWEDKGFAVTYPTKDLSEAIKELEVIRDNIKTSIEEIEWALTKPDYAEVYLNNALNLLKERV